MLVNVVEAPEPVLCYFCQYQRLHEVPIAGKLRSEDIQRITANLWQLQSFFTATMRVRSITVADEINNKKNFYFFLFFSTL